MKEQDPKQATIGEALDGSAPEPASEAIAEASPPPSAQVLQRVESKAPMLAGQHGIELRDLSSLWRFAQMVAASGLAPKGMEKPEAVAVAIQLGLELGLPPMAALQNIAVINGRPGVFGDAALAIVRASGQLEDFDEWYEVGGKRAESLPAQGKATDDVRAGCMSQRVGSRPRIEYFSVADARAAGLWGKAGPWTQYYPRMLRFRARGFNLRDNFGDFLKGFRTVEEIGDYREIEPADEPIAMPTRASESAAPAPATEAVAS